MGCFKMAGWWQGCVVLFAVFFVKFSVADSGDSGEKGSPEQPIEFLASLCSPFLKYPNGSESQTTVTDYLNDSSLLPCSHFAIGRYLKLLFQDTPKGAMLRAELGVELNTTCYYFVDIISRFWAREQFLKNYVCGKNRVHGHGQAPFFDGTLLSPFCSRTRSRADLSSLMASEVVGNLRRIGFSAYSHELSRLMQSSAEGCPMLCGSGYRKILCNAFLSAADLFTLMLPSLTETLTGPDQQAPLSNVPPGGPDANAIASVPPESSDPPTGPPASIRSIVSHMKDYMLRLSDHELLALAFVEPYKLGHVLTNIPGIRYNANLSREITYLASLPGARHLVRMFWVLSVSRWYLNKLNHKGIKFFQLDLIRDLPVFERLSEAGFEDLETVLLGLYTYRDVLLHPYEDYQDDDIYITRATTSASTARQSWKLARGRLKAHRFLSETTTEDWDRWDGLGRDEYLRRLNRRIHAFAAVRITLIVLGSLLGVFVAFMCLSFFICCCVSKWDKMNVSETAGCNFKKAKYYKVSTTEEID